MRKSIHPSLKSFIPVAKPLTPNSLQTRQLQVCYSEYIYFAEAY